MNEKLIKELALKYPNEILQPFDEIMEGMGFENLYFLITQFGGSTLYIPNCKTVFNACFSHQMKKEFNGNNLRELSRRYGYCEKTIKMMIQ